MNSFFNLLGPLSEVDQLFERAFEIVDRRGRIAISDGIHPQNAIASGQSLHDVFLAEWVAVPVIAEAYDVLAFDHVK